MKKCILLVMCCLLLISTVGCSSSDKNEYPIYDENATMTTVASGVISSNETYELIWDDVACCVMLKDRQTEKIWSNIPYEYLQEGGTSANVNSTVNVTAASKANMSWDSYRGYTEAVSTGMISC